MNLGLYGLGTERRRQWIAVDIGVAFAGEDLPGIDLILPDIRFLIEERRNLLGIVLTHAHEDHFGALIDLWPRLRVPVYATPFTAALFEAKRRGEPGAPDVPINGGAARRPHLARPLRHRIRLDGAFDPGIERAHHQDPARHRSCTPATGRSTRRR